MPPRKLLFARTWLALTAVALGACDDDPSLDHTTAALEPHEHILEGAPFGSLPGEVVVGDDGSASYTIPLTLPPARRGIGPSLSVAYSSSGGEGILGPRFNLAGLSSVSRCPQIPGRDPASVGVSLNDHDRLCLDGQRLVPITPASGAFIRPEAEYTPEQDPTTKVTLVYGAASGPETVIVHRADGTRATYGGTVDSRVAAPTAPNPTVLSWLLSRVDDRDGNYYTVAYATNPFVENEIAERFPDRIEYTGWEGATGVEPPRTVITFAYRTRVDRRGGYKHGFDTGRSQLLERIAVTNHDEPVREYRFEYDDTVPAGLPVATRITRLARMSECATALANVVCLPPTQFGWGVNTDLQPGTPEQPFQELELAGIAPTFRWDGREEAAEFLPTRSIAAVDIDGDGAEDLAYFEEVDPDPDAPGWSSRLLLRMGSRDAATALAAVHDTGFVGHPATHLLRLDYDKDGRDDLLMITTSGVWVLRSDGTSYSWVNTGLAFRSSETPSAPRYWGHELADVDGDTLEDLLVCSAPAPGSCTSGAVCPGRWFWARGLAGGFQPWSDTTIDDDCATEFAFHTRGVGDFDGDGRAELLISSLARFDPTSREPGDGARRLMAFDGGAFSVRDTNLCSFRSDEPLDTCEGRDTAAQVKVADVNGDGLHDIVAPVGRDGVDYRYDTVYVAYGSGDQEHPFRDYHDALSAGTDDFLESEYTNVLAQPGTLPKRIHLSPIALDLTGDGRADLIQPTVPGAESLISSVDCDGDRCPVMGWERGYTFPFFTDGYAFEHGSVPTRWDPKLETGSSPYRPLRRTQFLIIDANGDGSRDLLSFTETSPVLLVDVGEVTLQFNRGGVPQLVTRVTNGLGHVTEIQYAPLTDRSMYTPGTDCEAPVRCVVDSRYVVKRVLVDNGTRVMGPGEVIPEGFNETRYRYTDLRQHAAVSAGFATRAVYDQRNGTTIYYYDNRTVLPGAVYPFAGLPRRVISWAWTPEPVGFEGQSSSYHATVTENTYSTRPFGFTDTVQTRLATSRVREFEADNTAFGVPTSPEDVVDPTRDVTTTYGYDDWGYVDYEHVDQGDWMSTYHVTTRAHDPSRWILGRVTSRITSSVGLHDRWNEEAFEYDDDGRLLSRTSQPSDAAARVELAITARDRFGNVTWATATPADGDARTTHLELDADGTFVTTTRNPLLHESEVQYHPGFGVPIASTDPNGNVTRSFYDAFGRPARTEAADGRTTITTREAATDPRCAFQVSVKVIEGPQTISQLDRLGRTVDVKQRAFGGAWARRLATYDERGLLASVTHPFAAAAPPGPAIHYEHDLVGRLLSIERAPGEVQHVWYGPNRQWHRDARGNVHEMELDGRGRIASVREPTGALTRYTYDVDDALATIEDVAGNLTTYEYDLYGRRVSASDPDRGATEYEYDAWGQLAVERHDAGPEIAFTRDRLGRVIFRMDSDGVTSFSYDTAAHGVGHLAQATSADGVTTSYTYDAQSRLDSYRQAIDGATYTLDVDHDAVGRLSAIHYPTGFTATYHYDGSGNLDQIKNGAGKVLFDVAAQDLDGNITKEKFGNNVITDRTFDPTTRRLQTLSTRGTIRLEGTPAPIARQLIHLGLEYDANGNVWRRNDGLHGGYETFTYDALDRLTRAERSAAIDEWSYDLLGNMTESPLGEHTYGERPHAVAEAGGEPYFHDALGRLIAGPDWNITYTTFDLPRQVTTPSGGAGFRYDAHRRRAMKIAPSGQTTYVAGLLEVFRVGATRKYRFFVPGPGRIVAQVQRTEGSPGETTLYFHPGPLGSIEAITDGDKNGMLQTYDAFGAPRDMGTSTTPPAIGVTTGFTGHEHDDDLGLINMRGRMYSPVLGRFLTVDPVMRPFAPQNLNGYSYVSNNPINRIDPTGFQEAPADSIVVQIGQDPDGTPVMYFSDFPIANESTASQGAPAGTEAARVSGEAASGVSAQLYTDPEANFRQDDRAWIDGNDHATQIMVPTLEEHSIAMSDPYLHQVGRMPPVATQYFFGVVSARFAYGDSYIDIDRVDMAIGVRAEVAAIVVTGVRGGLNAECTVRQGCSVNLEYSALSEWGFDVGAGVSVNAAIGRGAWPGDGSSFGMSASEGPIEFGAFFPGVGDDPGWVGDGPGWVGATFGVEPEISKLLPSFSLTYGETDSITLWQSSP
jgi:RHS repeat-associated protein